MTSAQLNFEKTFRVLLLFSALSLFATVSYFALSRSVNTLIACGSIGLVCALFGIGGSVWLSLHSRQVRCLWAVALSLCPLLYWIWEYYTVLHTHA